jgi:hypothetical protein
MTIGTGLLGWIDADPVERAKFELEHEEREKRRAAEQAAEEAALAEKQAREAELQAVYDQIEACVLPYVSDAADKVNASAQIAPEDREVFEAFREYCTTWTPPLPCLPAHPASVAAFLVHELDQGVAHFMTRLHALSRVHRSVGFKDQDPADDVLLKSLVRTLEQTEKQKGSN